MRIEIPHSAHPLTRVNVITPDGGMISGDFINTIKHFDVELPEGVTEDEVSIAVEYLNNGNAVVDRVIVKCAIEKPADPPADEKTDAQIDAEFGDDCECGEKEACSTCDPEDEIAEPKDAPSDE